MLSNFWDKYGHVVSGVGGGTTKFFLDAVNGIQPFEAELLKAGVTAGICAVCSLAAKDIYQWFKKRL